MNAMQKTNEMRNEQGQQSEQNEARRGEPRKGRFEWIVSDFTIGMALLVLVTPAVYEGINSLNSLPVI